MSSQSIEPKKIENHVDKFIVALQQENSDENTVNHREEVVIGSEQGTTFPTKVGTTMCNALIDTSATRSCMSEKYYRKLQLNEICLLQNIHVRSATGSNLSPLGIVDGTFELGKAKFRSDFIICKNLNRPPILG